MVDIYKFYSFKLSLIYNIANLLISQVRKLITIINNFIRNFITSARRLNRSHFPSLDEIRGVNALVVLLCFDIEEDAGYHDDRAQAAEHRHWIAEHQHREPD